MEAPLAHPARARIARQAVTCYARAVELDSTRVESWVALSALSLLEGRPRDALTAALAARAHDRDGAAPLMAMGAALYRLGILDYADTTFREARARLAPGLRRRFDGEGAFGALEAPTSSTIGPDPDLTTPENESQLDYLTRLTLALYLFRDGGTLHWDKRAELFLRYGPPSSIHFNPAGFQIGEGNNLEYHFPRFVSNRYAPGSMGYPYNMQFWQYPELGMEVVLWDRSLSQNYELPPNPEKEGEPSPDPAVLAARGDITLTPDGRGVLRTMAPGSRPMRVASALSRFPEAGGARLVVNAFAAGGPADTLAGAWAIADASGHVIERGTRDLAAAACDPTERRVATFAASMPPGDYRVDVAITGPHGRRGVSHFVAHVETPGEPLALGDLVLLCGAPMSFGPEATAIERNVNASVAVSQPVTAYFEMEGLRAGAGGQARFAYTYTVRKRKKNGEPDERSAPVFEATREEEQAGAHRRQFLTVPAASVPPGAYVLRVEVRDLVSGATARTEAAFTKSAQRLLPPG